jgi:hypothetical protein
MIHQLSLETTEENLQKLRFLTKDMVDVLLKLGKKLELSCWRHLIPPLPTVLSQAILH